MLLKGAEEGIVFIVEHLVKLNTSLAGHMQMTPLHLAAENGHSIIVKMLLEAGAGTEIKNPQGETPLLLATRYNHLSVCKILLSCGANVNVSDHRKNTALHYAAMLGYLSMVQLFVMYGADMTAVNDNGRSPLDEAERHSEIYVTRWLQMELTASNISQKPGITDVS